MPDLDSALATITRFADRPPFAPRPEPEVERRAGALRRHRRARRSGAAALVLVVGLAATAVGLRAGDDGAGSVVGESPTPNRAPVDPHDFVDEVMDIIEAEGYVAEGAVAPSRDQAARAAGVASTTADTYPFINDALVAMDATGSSMLLPPGSAANMRESGTGGPVDDRPSAQVSGGVGRLTLPPIAAAPTTDDGASYIAAARSVLRLPTCGWVVDLQAIGSDVRTDLATILSALAPLLGPGTAVEFMDDDGMTESHGVDVTGLNLPVAVLQGAGTTSEWEDVVLAFRSRPRVRTFGQPTAGRSGRTETFGPLSDGSVLLLLTGTALDPAGNPQVGPIAPDEAHDISGASAAANAWLAADPGCQATDPAEVANALEELMRADATLSTP
jgi:carboxyl-terminal processing protease